MSDLSYPLFQTVKEMGIQLGSSYKDCISNRDKIIDFMDANQWFGVDYRFTNSEIFLRSIEPFRKQLQIWLKAYGCSNEEKIELILKVYEKHYPVTCERFRKYIEMDKKSGTEASIITVDFIFHSLTKELEEYSEEEISVLLDLANAEITLTAMQYLIDFLQWPFRGRPITSWHYRFMSRQIVSTEQSAYSLKNFSRMAYIILNQESWEKLELIEKASVSKIYANLWLYAALHFVCALRKSDMLRLPVPTLPYPPEQLRQMIVKNELTDYEAKAIVNEVVFRQQMKNRKPNKTSEKRVPLLKFFVPESILIPMGIIMGLALSFRQEGDPFVDSNAELTQIRSFFGDDFAKCVGNKKFMTRRANKSYLQGLESVADEKDGIAGRPKGYMIAALARSHKGGIGTLPEITDIYLKDENFTGYTPEFILREMFERGIFGFIPVMLLEKYMGKEFRSLDVSSQTKLITSIGLEPEQIENVMEIVMASRTKAYEIIHGLLNGEEQNRSTLACLLQTIASGEASSRQEECLCLMTAANYPCPYPERGGCIGCGYEIYTKTSAHLLMNEYVALSKRISINKTPEKARLRNLLQKAILPAIVEILESIPLLYPGADMEPVYQIVERGMKHADCIE